MSIDFRCKYCADNRHPGCHDHCPIYKEDRAAYDAKKKQINDKKMVDNYVKRAIAEKRNAGAIHRKRYSWYSKI